MKIFRKQMDLAVPGASNVGRSSISEFSQAGHGFVVLPDLALTRDFSAFDSASNVAYQPARYPVEIQTHGDEGASQAFEVFSGAPIWLDKGFKSLQLNSLTQSPYADSRSNWLIAVLEKGDAIGAHVLQAGRVVSALGMTMLPIPAANVATYLTATYAASAYSQNFTRQLVTTGGHTFAQWFGVHPTYRDMTFSFTPGATADKIQLWTASPVINRTPNIIGGTAGFIGVTSNPWMLSETFDPVNGCDDGLPYGVARYRTFNQPYTLFAFAVASDSAGSADTTFDIYVGEEMGET